MANTRHNKYINTIDECLTNGVNNGIFQVHLENNYFDGRHVTINNKSVVNFGSCSYLGLEVDPRLKQGAINATNNYGTQYSSSRLFSACNLYDELETLLSKIFNNTPTIIAATTTLTHVSAIPILVEDSDLVILDHQVHGSVQLAVQLLKARGVRVEMIKHNNLNMLEDIIKQNPNKYNKVWYMADGLYSMYGDYAPLNEINELMNKYNSLHLYIDDAHGMSWTGTNGNGYVFDKIKNNPKAILSTSLAKGFGTGGGVLVINNPEMKRKILTCGSSYTFSGPVQPPMLGASIESAKIHLSNEITELQNQLKSKIGLASTHIQNNKLPLVLPSDSPIFYIALGLPRTGYNMVKRLLKEGFYTNIGIFPGVPVRCTGLRLAITNGQTNDDIKNVIDAFTYHLPKVLEEEKQSIEEVANNFNLDFSESIQAFPFVGTKKSDQFSITHETTINNINEELWDNLLGANGTFDWKGCQFLEETFSGNPDPENNWKFHYLIIYDNNKPLLATFFTELLCKDDMVASASASQQIEEIRKTNKYYLTSKVIMMGSLLSVGEHLYLDRTNNNWPMAVREMLTLMNQVKRSSGSNMIQLRDIDSNDTEISELLIKEGFVKVEMPSAHTLTKLEWKTEEEYLKQLSTHNRWHLRRKILDKKHYFNVQALSGDNKHSATKLEEWKQLYSNVKEKSYNINTFPLPDKYFINMVNHPNWEIIELRLNESEPVENHKLASVGFCYKNSKNNYTMMTVGVDYKYVPEHGAYRQALYQSIVRAAGLKCNLLYLGMDASIEKQRFGVQIEPKSVFIQANDNFNMELITTIHS